MIFHMFQILLKKEQLAITQTRHVSNFTEMFQIYQKPILHHQRENKVRTSTYIQ